MAGSICPTIKNNKRGGSMYPTHRKIKRSRYEKLKKDYLKKDRTLHSLYMELNEEIHIERQTFFRLIDMIRMEEGYKPLNRKK